MLLIKHRSQVLCERPYGDTSNSYKRRSSLFLSVFYLRDLYG